MELQLQNGVFGTFFLKRESYLKNIPDSADFALGAVFVEEAAVCNDDQFNPWIGQRQIYRVAH